MEKIRDFPRTQQRTSLGDNWPLSVLHPADYPGVPGATRRGKHGFQSYRRTYPMGIGKYVLGLSLPREHRTVVTHIGI